MFRATHNGYCNKERVRTPVLVQKGQITPSLFSHPVYTNLLTQYIPDERRGMEELAFSVPNQVNEPVLYCNIHCELRRTSVMRHVMKIILIEMTCDEECSDDCTHEHCYTMVRIAILCIGHFTFGLYGAMISNVRTVHVSSWQRQKSLLVHHVMEGSPLTPTVSTFHYTR